MGNFIMRVATLHVNSTLFIAPLTTVSLDHIEQSNVVVYNATNSYSNSKSHCQQIEAE